MKMTIQQIGSSRLLPLAEKWRTGFNDKYSDVQLAVSGGGCSTGVQALINGTAQIANSSRRIEKEEKQQAAQTGIESVEHVVACDGIAVIIHSSNPVAELSIEQLSEIFSGRITDRSEVG